MEIRCPSCSRKAGDTNKDSYVKITCQRCSVEYTLTKGVYEVLPPKTIAQAEKQKRFKAKRKMSEANYQSRLVLRRK